MSTTFIKKREDFTCEHCGYAVKGTGYTNHCPQCLWSKHVDVNPGDRLATCGGMMKPMKVEGKTDEYVIVHQCEKCGYMKRNKVVPEDSYDKVLEIVKEFIAREEKNRQ